MSKNIYYRYNSETDNFERFYPSLKNRIVSISRILFISLLISSVFITVFLLSFDAPSEVNLREENRELRTKYKILQRRLESSLIVMQKIQNRDDNFYRVMLQMDPLVKSRRFAGLDYESNFNTINSLTDAQLIEQLTNNLDLLDRKLYAQSQSFDELRNEVEIQKEKLKFIPSIIPLNDFKMAAGFGTKREPIYGKVVFHDGLDFAASEGTPVHATADGTVKFAERKGGYGKYIELDHGFNYSTCYGNLRSIIVKQGEKVKRGETIGYVGNTGKSTAPHLHYEVRFKGEAQNPVNYCFMDLSPEKYAEMTRLADDATNVMD